MKAITLTTLICCILAATGAARADGDGEMAVKAMTFNILFNHPADDSPNRWQQRREMVVEVVRRFEGDFVGLQEVSPKQMADLLGMLPKYRSLGSLCMPSAKGGYAAPIFYRHERWRLDEKRQGTFWLSDTPHVPGSTTWGNGCPRIVTWGRFIENETERGVYVFNTHFCSGSAPSRTKSAALLAERIAARTLPEPVLLTGDFNAVESSEPIEYLTGKRPESPIQLVDTFRVLHPDEKQAGTFHGFSGETQPDKIDYVFALSEAKVRSAEIIRFNRDGRYPSDHFPVAAEVAYRVEYTRLVFEDRFEKNPVTGWTWLRERPRNCRIADGGLEIRVEPGQAHTVNNALLRPAPDRTRGKYAVEVTVAFTTPPTNQFEQAGIAWYQKGKPILKLVHELIDGKMYIIPGKVPAPEKTVRLRLIVDADKFVAQFRPKGKDKFQTVASGPLPAGPDERVGIQCYNGPADAKHWIRFTDFRILRL